MLMLDVAGFARIQQGSVILCTLASSAMGQSERHWANALRLMNNPG